MKTHPIEAAIGLVLIVCWAVVTLIVSAVALAQHLQRTTPSPVPEAPPEASAAPEAPVATAEESSAVQVLQLHQAGMSQRVIAQHLGISRSRVRRLLATSSACLVSRFSTGTAEGFSQPA